jgi:hypothetical protein
MSRVRLPFPAFLLKGVYPLSLYSIKRYEAEGTIPGHYKIPICDQKCDHFWQGGGIVARSSYLLFKRETQKKTLYYVKIWLPADGKYTTAKSCSVIADTLGIDRKE